MIAVPQAQTVAAVRLAQPRKILVALDGPLGEALLAAPLLAALHRRFPKAVVQVLARAGTGALLRRYPFVDEVLALPEEVDELMSRPFLVKNLWRFSGELKAVHAFGADLALAPSLRRSLLADAALLASNAPLRIGWAGTTDAEGAAEAGQRTFFLTHMLDSSSLPFGVSDRYQAFATALGLAAEAVPPVLPEDPEASAAADQMLADLGLDPERTLAVFPGPGVRRFPPGRFAEQVEGALGGRPWDVLLLGSALDGAAFAGQLLGRTRAWVPAFGRLDHRTTAAVLRRLPLAIGHEGDWIHLACAAGRTHVVLAGGGQFAQEFAYSPLTVVACRPLECYFCDWACPHPQQHCLTDLRPGVVAAAVDLALTGTDPRCKVALDAAAARPDQPGLMDLRPALDPARTLWVTLD